MKKLLRVVEMGLRSTINLILGLDKGCKNDVEYLEVIFGR